MFFDPFDFNGNGNGNGLGNGYGYGYGYGDSYGGALGGIMQSFYWVVGLLIAAVVIGIILNFTFLRKKNEGRFHGFWGKVYNCFCMNRFYTEGIIKLLNVITFFVLTFLGIYMICTGGVVSGILVIVLGNLAARVGYELVIMFAIMCRKAVSVDKRLSKVEKFYDDMEEWDVNDEEASSWDSQEAEETKEEEPVVIVSAPAPEAGESGTSEDAVEMAAFAGAAAEPAPEIDALKEKLQETFGDPNAPKYGYDEECKTCDNWSAEEEDCYCEDDCLTCDKPDQDKKAEEVEAEPVESAPAEETKPVDNMDFNWERGNEAAAAEEAGESDVVIEKIELPEK